MHRSRLCGYVIDCQVDDLDSAARFWSAALGRPIAGATTETGDYRELQAQAEEPQVLLQKVDHQSRIHLDIEADDLDAEVARLEALGARRIGFVKRWWVMEAPTGHRFCVVRPQRGELSGKPGASEWPSPGN